MRLLDAHTKELVEKEFIGDKPPPYAILSHTWGDDEVSFQDMKTGKSVERKGYMKIEYCCDQAFGDGFRYAWVDTCCIDKSSSAELSEAINSMFKWYQNSAVCYVYLSDVARYATSDELKTQFRKSRWFSRGWTLQELIAPQNLIFYSSNWREIGDRSQWTLDIMDVTRIHQPALSGKPWALEQFSIAQKMSWASDRETTREEDIAYSLLGIFNVNIPLLYGEGGKAFIRLQEAIVKTSDDQSIFAWGPRQLREGRFMRGALAPTPEWFYHCFDIVSARNFAATELYTVTNSGLRIMAPLVPLFSDANTRLVEEVKEDLKFHLAVRYLIGSKSETNGAYVLILDCYKEGHPELLLGIILIPTVRHDQYSRCSLRPLLTSCEGLSFCEGKTIYISESIGASPAISDREKGIKTSFSLIFSPPDVRFEVLQAVPSEQWDIKNLSLSPPDSQTQLCAYNGWSWRAGLLLKVTYMNSMMPLTVVFGYDGRKQRPWIGLRAGLEKFMEYEKGLIYGGWNTNCCEQEVVVCASPFDYMIRVTIISMMISLLGDPVIFISDDPLSEYTTEEQNNYEVKLGFTWRPCGH